MSIEAWLFAIAFLVLPLVQMFREASQRSRERSQQQVAQEHGVPGRPARPPKMQTPRPPESGNPKSDVTAELPAALSVELNASRVASPAAVRQTLSDKVAARRRAAEHERTAESSLNRADRKQMRTVPEVIRGMRSRGGLQRAMVVMAILGPCRAVQPHAGRETHDSR